MIGCQIRAADRNGVLQLDAVVKSSQPSQGQYRLEVIKTSSTGSSHNVQDGAFVLDPDTSAILTTVVLDGSAVGHYRATLRITSQSGSITCVSP